jgi:amino-acid N-acetyltransferase
MTIRDALPEDLEEIQQLLRGLRLPVEGVAEHWRRFLVLELEDRVAGTVGLEVYGDQALLRSLGVAKGLQGRGHGQRLCEAVLDRARALGLREIILLTETAQRFFARQGFEVITREEAGPAVGASVEFRAVCPVSAVCMRLRLR